MNRSRWMLVLAWSSLCAAVLLSCGAALAAPQGGSAAMEKASDGKNARTEIATLGGGCFWCLDAIFEELRGVSAVQSGFSGGRKEDATYERVCSGRTGHAEVVQITFDPSVITFSDLLDVFFTIHDPTTLNRQGADVGTQYRSVIFFHSPEQKKEADEAVARLAAQKLWDAPIVTQVVPFEAFYKAEDYHQSYYDKNASAPYCQIVIAPKVAKFREKFLAKLSK